MGRDNAISTGAAIVLSAGVILLLYSFYYIQQLSYSIGVYSGISTAIRSYNLTNASTTNTLIAAVSQSTTLLFALHISYVLLPFAILIFGIGIVWLFTKSYMKYTSMILVLCSIIFAVIVTVLEFDFKFTSILSAIPAAYIGSAAALICGVYYFWRTDYRPPQQKRPVHPISINPDTPYSNMRTISSRLMSKLSGDLRILDMHFDATALGNLMQLIDKNSSKYRGIMVLTKADRLGSDFDSSFKDFKRELENRNVQFELRVLDQQSASKQHERLLMDDSTAYKIPPLNIINKKSDHIVGINFKEASRQFNDLWAEARRFENTKTN